MFKGLHFGVKIIIIFCSLFTYFNNSGVFHNLQVMGNRRTGKVCFLCNITDSNTHAIPHFHHF